MNISNTSTQAVKLVFFAFLTIFSASNIFAQENIKTEAPGFLVTVEITNNNQIKMECKNGCAWETFTFSLSNPNEKHAIDENGTVDLEKVNSENDEKSTGYLFSIEKTRKGVRLKGIEGTSWTDLSFSLEAGQKLWLTERGMIE